MTECIRQITLFSIGKRKVTFAPDGRLVGSDAGALALAKIDRRLALSQRLAAVLIDRRDPDRVIHTYEAQLRQRIFQIACGYEDADDGDALRLDPIFQTAMGRVPGVEASALASQPTLSRFEQREYSELLRLSEVLVDIGIDHLLSKGRRALRRVILDFDTTDDPTHGAQQLSMFHGYYDQHMYHPLLVFDGEGWPVAVVLRPGNAHASRGAVSILLRIFKSIVDRLPSSTEIIFRADAGFAVPEIYEMCETLGIRYVIGQITNDRYKERAKKAMREARREFKRTGEKSRVFMDFQYRAQSWDKPRRIVAKAEMMKEGENPRFVITNLNAESEATYEFYGRRGQSENHIKDLKNAMFADRLSCSDFRSNQFRLLLHTAAYILMYVLREQLADTELANAQMDTLRLKVMKVGASIVVTARKIWVHVSQSHPKTPLLTHLIHQLYAASP